MLEEKEDIMKLKTNRKYQLLDDELLSKFNNNEILETEISGQTLFTNEKKRIFIPKVLAKEFIKKFHDYLIHPGTQKLYNSILPIFIWKNMFLDCKKKCETCDICQRKKRTNKNVKYGKIPLSSRNNRPWFEIEVDSIGPFFKNITCLTIIDTCSLITEMGVVHDNSSAETASLTDQEWFCRYPRLVKCIHDSGTEFKLEFSELLESYGVENVCTSVRNPQANAICERVHSTINEMIRTGEINENNIKDILPNINYAIRTSYSHSLKTSPGEAIFQRHMIYDINHNTNWRKVHEDRIEEMKKSNIRENKKIIDYEYLPDDLVLIKLDIKKLGKVEEMVIGPFPVVAVRENGVVIINKGKYLESWNIRNLHPWKETDDEKQERVRELNDKKAKQISKKK